MSCNSIIITGGCGFIGSHLAEYYLKQNFQVIAVDNFCTGLRSNGSELVLKYGDQFRVIEADVIRPWDDWTANLDSLLNQGKLKYIFHFASPASPPIYQAMGLETLWVNSIGLNEALKLSDHFGARLVFASTSEIYGDPLNSPQKESDWGNVNSYGPRSCYDESKRFGEALLYTHNLKYKTKHGLVRIFNTYGPRMNPGDGRVIVNFLVQALKNQNLTVYGDGKQTRSFCYISDLVEGIVRYAESMICEPVNLGNENEFTILELTQVIFKLFSEKNLKLDFRTLPKDDPTRRRPDTSKARLMLNQWRPKVDLEAGLMQMINWLKLNELAK